MTSPARIESIEKGTGRSWDAWVAFLDGIGAAELDHTAIAARVLDDMGDDVESAAWWAQGVTVAYEQHIGRRLPGQRADGTFQMSVSKSTPVPMAELMDRWEAFAADSAPVLALLASTPRRGGTDKRLTWRAKGVDGSAVMVTAEPRSAATASVIASQVGTPDLESNDAARAMWKEVLAEFVATLPASPSR
ncbi:hypothetical protein [Demequina sp.]|uniref:hypothetical protein n=1 Tax=Demequina sp. TaxID=2050685 RepID=UPI003A88F084